MLAALLCRHPVQRHAATELIAERGCQKYHPRRKRVVFDFVRAGGVIVDCAGTNAQSRLRSDCVMLPKPSDEKLMGFETQPLP
jgi:hypothetical protein